MEERPSGCYLPVAFLEAGLEHCYKVAKSNIPFLSCAGKLEIRKISDIRWISGGYPAGGFLIFRPWNLRVKNLKKSQFLNYFKILKLIL